ncbi:uncharacterized protein LOC113549730 [Rhopalosiphum maidis]|uniref:uncharacterized protein LOC113549730 n=1 Tax=Rhopalosiphum maidis TaxID=43146 RepID=UPI000F0069A2|nr:uncharacterized protein LOC113549730 [Rhopalosiphum maidis]
MLMLCAIVGYSNKTTNKNISFYCFPKVKMNAASDLKMKMNKQQNAWLKSLHRLDLPNKNIDYMRVCSAHFKSGKLAKYQAENDPDWYPTLNMGYCVTSGKSKLLDIGIMMNL